MSFDPSVPIYKSFRNKLTKAFMEPHNLIGLSSAAALSLALLNPLPLLCGVVMEAAYLLFVPDSKWYESRLETQFDAEVLQRREDLKKQIYPKTRPEIHERFQWLEQARAQIQTAVPTNDKWFREALRKLDFLMEKYLQFALKEAEFSKYLLTLVEEVYPNLSASERAKVGYHPPKIGAETEEFVDPTENWVTSAVDAVTGNYEREAGDLKEKADKEAVFATKEIMLKRSEVVHRRKEFANRIGQILTNLGHQMQLMSDTFGLINDEIRARSPEQVLADIDDVVMQTASLTQAIESITPLDSLVATPGSSQL